MKPCELYATTKAFCSDETCEHCVYYQGVMSLIENSVPLCVEFWKNLITCEKDDCAYCDRVRVIVHELVNSPEAPALEKMEDIPPETFVMGTTDGLDVMIRNFNRTVNGSITLPVTSDDFQALVYALRGYSAGFSSGMNTPDDKRKDTAYQWLKELAERFGVEFQ